MNIYPEPVLTIECPECGSASAFLCADLLDIDINLNWPCGHSIKNNNEILHLCKFYTNEMILTTKKLKENKETIQNIFKIDFNSEINIKE